MQISRNIANGPKVIIRFWWESGLSSESRSHLTTFCRVFANYACLRLFRDSSLYPKQSSLLCLLWLTSANFTKTLVWKTWTWRQIMTSQTMHTKYKWHHRRLNESPLKIFCVRHCSARNDFYKSSIAWTLQQPTLVFHWRRVLLLLLCLLSGIQLVVMKSRTQQSKQGQSEQDELFPSFPTYIVSLCIHLIPCQAKCKERKLLLELRFSGWFEGRSRKSIRNLEEFCCSWLHRLELLRQAQEKDGNSGH